MCDLEEEELGMCGDKFKKIIMNGSSFCFQIEVQ